MIAAVSSRPFVHAAVTAGYTVLALDAFADVDTRRVAEQVYKIDYANSGFDAKQFEAALDQINTSDMLGFAYGSGFEGQPDLLERIAKRLPIIGNTPEVLRRIKDASCFFGMLDPLAIPHPELSFTSLVNADGWICKEQGGSGGSHVLNASANQVLSKDQYYQRVKDGTSISMLFAANGSEIKLIGFNEQWTAPIAGKPYRYGGIVGHVNLPFAIKQSLQETAHKITLAFGLRGLNSLDVIWQDDNYWVLEINPRLSSTLDLHQTKESNLFALHVQAVNGDLRHFPEISSRSKARKVLYASQDLVIAEDFVWPEWTADIPLAPTVIAQHQPICTVLADADTAVEARALVVERVEQLSVLLFK